MMTEQERQEYKEALKYIYTTKNGLKSDFLLKFKENDYHRFLSLGFIFPCIRSTQEDSWKITKAGYDFAFLEFHEEKLSLFEKFQHWINEIVYFKKERKRYLKNKQDKEDYFKNI